LKKRTRKREGKIRSGKEKEAYRPRQELCQDTVDITRFTQATN